MPHSMSPASEPGKDETFHEGNLWAMLEVQSPRYGTQSPSTPWLFGNEYFQVF